MNGRARRTATSPRLRPPPVLLAILFSTLVGGALVLFSGHNPLHAYAEIVEGSLSLDSLPDTLNWATPLVGMTLVAAIPLRGGMLNLGGDGQLVIGGLIGALLPLVLPGPGALVSVAALATAGARRGPLRGARRLGRSAPRRPDADLESAAELSGRRRDVLSRALSLSRRSDGAAANRDGPNGGAALYAEWGAQRREPSS